MTADHNMRDGMIYQAQQERMSRDVKIMQKVGAVNREAFVQRFPGQLEHSMRLVSERLQACLTKPEGTDLSAPASWPATAGEIASLSQALLHLETIRQHWPVQEA